MEVQDLRGGGLRALLGKILEGLLLTERTCIHCEESFAPEEQGYLCGKCISSIKPFPYFLELPELEQVDGAEFFGRYEGALREALKLLKFRGVKPMGKVLGKKIREELLSYLRETEADFLTWVPVHFLRYWGRGYDHNEEILRHTGLPFRKALKRVRYSRPLAGYGRKERERRVKGAYRVVRPHLVEGRRVLVFDDILTTGSTAREVAGVLKEAGASEVYFYFLCRE